MIYVKIYNVLLIQHCINLNSSYFSSYLSFSCLLIMKIRFKSIKIFLLITLLSLTFISMTLLSLFILIFILYLVIPIHSSISIYAFYFPFIKDKSLSFINCNTCLLTIAHSFNQINFLLIFNNLTILIHQDVAIKHSTI